MRNDQYEEQWIAKADFILGNQANGQGLVIASEINKALKNIKANDRKSALEQMIKDHPDALKFGVRIETGSLEDIQEMQLD